MENLANIAEPQVIQFEQDNLYIQFFNCLFTLCKIKISIGIWINR